MRLLNWESQGHIRKRVRMTVKDVTPDELEKLIKQAKLVIVDCWAPWCGPCHALLPVLEELQQKYSSNRNIAFVKLNTDTHKSYASQMRIYSIPCVLFFHNGQPTSFIEPVRYGMKEKRTDRLIGVRPIRDYENVIKQILG
ncbi:MAG: thioredoxin family protein [Candidatus Thorarchaeota archaeon]|nr:thioredoxin family protein [Candidatus Thorarchaeota archaeon]